MNSFSCPALSDLFSHATESHAHIANCPRCQALLSLRDERLDLAPENRLLPALSLNAPARIPGEIALVAAPESDELLPAIVVRQTDDAVTVVPLSEEIRRGAEWDMLLPKEILGYGVIAETWNRGRVLPEQIVEVIARLPEELFTPLIGLLRSSAAGTARPAEAAVGPAILSASDPRLRFQDEESERAHVFWEQTLALAGAASLGELVAARRDEMGIASEELAGLSLRRDWLAELERDELDPSTLTRPILVGLMRRLSIAASRRLGRITYETILMHRGGEPAEGLAFARKRKGLHASAETEDPEQFVTAFLEDLARAE